MLILNEKDFKIIQSIYDTTITQLGGVNTNGKIYIGINNLGKKLLKDILTRYIGDMLKTFEIGTAVASDQSTPSGIHTDYDQVKTNPGYGILIPLETINSSTIVFNEKCTDSFELFKTYSPKLEKNSVYLHDNLLSNMNKDDLFYVSVQSINNWIQGKLILWDLDQLHASDNFIANGIKNKKCILIFTEKV